MTVGVLSLDTPEKVEQCVRDFSLAAKNLRETRLFTAQGFRITFDRFDMFDDRVLFLKPTEECIDQFRELRRCLFAEPMSVFDPECRPVYNPHMTLAKRTKWVSKRRPAELIPEMPKDVGVFDGIDVDVQSVVRTVELVQMRGQKEEDGYYRIIASEPLV